MAGPQIDIQAQTQSAEAALRRLTDAFNKLGQAAAGATRTKFQVIDPEELGQVGELEEKLRQIMQMHPSIRSAVRASNQNPATPASVNWANVPMTPSQVRTMMQHLSGGANRFTRPDDPQDASRIGEGIARSMGRFFGGVGGGAGQVGGTAIGGAIGGGGGFSLGGLLRGGLVGAGLFGAFKAGQMVSEGIDNAKLLAMEMDKLKRSMGDIGVSFGALQIAADAASQGLEINSVEAGKLMAEFNRLSGGVKDSEDLVGGTRTGAGMAKAFGLDPNSGVAFLANIRNMQRGGSVEGDRRLALMIGDVVTRSGMNARADEVLQAVQSFAAATSKISLTSPNLAEFGSMYAGMLNGKIPGLTPENAAAMLGQANSAMTNMGAYGEASETFTLSALQRYGDLNPIQARVLSEGGLYGTRGSAFGKDAMGRDSVYRRYMKQEGVSEEEIDKLVGQNAGVTNFEAIRKQLDSMNVTPDLKAEMAKNFFGLSSISQAMAFMSATPEEMGKTEKLLGNRGINLKDYSETGITTLSGIANANSTKDLDGIASDLLQRKGEGALSAEERGRLTEAMKEANRLGGDEGFKRLQDVLADLAAGRDKQETLGSQMLDQQKKIETAMTNVGSELLRPLVDMKEILMAGFGLSENKAMQKVLDIRKKEIDEDYDAKIKPIDEQLSDARSNWREAKVLSMLPGSPARAAESAKEWDARIEDLKQQKKRLEDERGASKKKIDDDFASDKKSREAARKKAEKASNQEAAPQPTAASLSDIKDPEQRTNVKSFLDTIAASEGAGYRTLVGEGKNNEEITDLSQHPNKVGLVTGDGPSTAAGRYQITGTTWKGVSKKLGLKDFSPESQDMAAIELLRQRGALDDVMAGRWDEAVAKLGNEWQSLPSGTSAHQGKRSKAFFDKTLKEALARNRAEQTTAMASVDPEMSAFKGKATKLPPEANTPAAIPKGKADESAPAPAIPKGAPADKPAPAEPVYAGMTPRPDKDENMSRRVESFTPLPEQDPLGKLARKSDPIQVSISGQFGLYGQDQVPKADPVPINTIVSIPSGAGT